MFEIRFLDNISDEMCMFAVIVSKYKDKWVFCKHKKRNTYESPRRKKRYRRRYTADSAKRTF